MVISSRLTWLHFVKLTPTILNHPHFVMLPILYRGGCKTLISNKHCTNGWFRYVWLFYAVTLIAVLIRKYIKRILQDKPITANLANLKSPE
jgi:hypothetical protein